MNWAHYVAYMATAMELRKDLLSLRVDRATFAKRCGMKLSAFDRMMNRGDELPELVMGKWRALRAERSSSEAPSEAEVELGRRGINPYVREIWLPGRIQGSLKVSPDFDGPLGLKVRVKQVEGEAPWVYELDGNYNRKGRLLESS